MPFLHGLWNFEKVLDWRLKRNRTLRSDHLYPCLKVADDLVPHLSRPFRKERLWVVDVADQSHFPVDGLH